MSKSKKHLSLLESYKQINQDDLKETAETITRINYSSEVNKLKKVSEDNFTDTQSTNHIIEPTKGTTKSPTGALTGEPTVGLSKQLTVELTGDASAYPTGEPSPVGSNPLARARQTAQMNPLENEPTEQPTGSPTVEPSEKKGGEQPPPYPLTDSQYKVLYFLYHKQDKQTSKPEITNETGVPFGTVRRILRVLVDNMFISPPKKKKLGRFQGFKYSINESLCKETLKKSQSLYGRLSSRSTTAPTVQPTAGPTEQRTDCVADCVTHSIDDDLLCTNTNHHLSDADLEGMYPNLFGQAEFRCSHIDQVIRAWKLKKLNLDELHDSLEKAEWDIKFNRPKMKTPLTYILSALKNGSYTAPPGFKYQRQIQAEESALVAEELRKLAEETLKNRFEHWWAVELTEDERKEVDREISAENRAIPATGNLRNLSRLEYYKKKTL